MQILVAGSTGNTGKRLVRELQARGHDRIALVRSNTVTAAHVPMGLHRSRSRDKAGAIA